eukprot:2911957-Rhodomonas_salina.1
MEWRFNKSGVWPRFTEQDFGRRLPFRGLEPNPKAFRGLAGCHSADSAPQTAIHSSEPQSRLLSTRAHPLRRKLLNLAAADRVPEPLTHLPALIYPLPGHDFKDFPSPPSDL